LFSTIAEKSQPNGITGAIAQELFAQVTRILHVDPLDRYNHITARNPCACRRTAPVKARHQHTQIGQHRLHRSSRTQFQTGFAPPNVAPGNPTANASKHSTPHAQKRCGNCPSCNPPASIR
jgi:hypothetical protein